MSGADKEYTESGTVHEQVSGRSITVIGGAKDFEIQWHGMDDAAIT